MVAEQGCIVGEDRDAQSGRVTFFAIDASTGAVLWNDVSVGDSTWIGMETAHRDVLFLHEYATPEMPGHQGITALDLRTGATLWRDRALQFLRASGDAAYASRETTGSQTFVELGLRTGSRRREFASGGDLPAPDPAHSPLEARMEFPRRSGPEEFPDLARRTKGGTVAEHLRKGGFLIATVHHRPSKGGEFDQHFTIFDATRGRVLFDEVLNAGATGQPDSFFLFDGTVLCVREQRTLQAFVLPQAASH